MNKIYVIGDLHQQFQPIRDFYTYMNSSIPLDETDIIICLGDFGANFFFDYRDSNFKKKISRYKCNFFVIRGNHEERPSICAETAPTEWTKEKFFENDVWVEKAFPQIKYTMDFPAVYNIKGLKTLIIPGAYSVDKYHRLRNNLTWFEYEQLTPEEMEIGLRTIELDENKYDLVLSHTCPMSYQPTDLFLSSVDQSLVDNTMERYLGGIERNLDYKLWLFGHFHQLRIYPVGDGEYKQMIMLFNNELIDLNKYFETNNPYDSLIKVHKESEN